MPRKNGLYTKCGVIATVIIGVLTILTVWGVIPWATSRDLETHKKEDSVRFEKMDRMDKQVGELHSLFFPNHKIDE